MQCGQSAEKFGMTKFLSETLHNGGGLEVVVREVLRQYRHASEDGRIELIAVLAAQVALSEQLSNLKLHSSNAGMITRKAEDGQEVAV